MSTNKISIPSLSVNIRGKDFSVCGAGSLKNFNSGFLACYYKVHPNRLLDNNITNLYDKPVDIRVQINIFLLMTYSVLEFKSCSAATQRKVEKWKR